MSAATEGSALMITERPVDGEDAFSATPALKAETAVAKAMRTVTRSIRPLMKSRMGVVSDVVWVELRALNTQPDQPRGLWGSQPLGYLVLKLPVAYYDTSDVGILTE